MFHQASVVKSRENGRTERQIGAWPIVLAMVLALGVIVPNRSSAQGAQVEEATPQAVYNLPETLLIEIPARPEYPTEAEPTPKSAENQFLINLRLPSEFVGVELSTEDLQLFYDATSEVGRNVPCLRNEAKPTLAEYVFDCPTSQSGRYFVVLPGFETIQLDFPEGSPSPQAYTLERESLLSKRSLSIVPARMAGLTVPELATEAPIGVQWFDLVGSNASGIIADYFMKLDPEATGVPRLCPAAAPLNISQFIGDGETITLALACDFIVRNFQGVSEALKADLSFPECIADQDTGKICVATKQLGLEDSIQMVLAGSTDLNAEPLPVAGSSVNIADYLTFKPDSALFSGSLNYSFAGFNEAYSVVEAEAFNDAGSCGRNNQMPLAGQSLGSFPCSDGLPVNRIEIKMKGAGLSGGVFLQDVSYSFNFPNSEQFLVSSPSFALNKVTLQLVASDGRDFPEFFQVRVYADEKCTSGSELVLEKALTRENRAFELTAKKAFGDLPVSFVLFNADKPMSRCNTLMPKDGYVRGNAEGEIEVQRSVDFIRPLGPYTILVLSPSKRLADDGWRNIVHSVLKQEISDAAKIGAPIALDMYKITENRGVSPIITAEDFENLQIDGNDDSLQARFDGIRYDATSVRPLNDIDLVEQKIKNQDVSKVFYISDASQEPFEPRDMGSIYHWLINRGIKLVVMSPSGCASWNELTARIENKVTCYDLNEIGGLPQRQRAQELKTQLRELGLEFSQ